MNSAFRLDSVRADGEMLRMHRTPQILVPSEGPLDWKPLLANPERQWKPGYSAMACAQCWEDAVEKMPSGLPPEISGIVGDQTRLILAIPEHQVPNPGGTTKSQSDVFALLAMGGATCTLTVEAARDRPFGRSVNKWAEKTERSDAILDCMSEVFGNAGRPPGHVPYQLCHRTASAIYEADRFNAGSAAMIVHSFFPEGENEEKDGFGDFAAFCAFLGVADVEKSKPMRTRLSTGQDLLLGWAEGDTKYLRKVVA